MKAKDLDKKFDAGEDISRYVEIDKARKPLRQAGNVQAELCTDELSKVSPERACPQNVRRRG
jgi:hypothetical protein